MRDFSTAVFYAFCGDHSSFDLVHQKYKIRDNLVNVLNYLVPGHGLLVFVA